MQGRPSSGSAHQTVVHSFKPADVQSSQYHYVQEQPLVTSSNRNGNSYSGVPAVVQYSAVSNPQPFEAMQRRQSAADVHLPSRSPSHDTTYYNHLSTSKSVGDANYHARHREPRNEDRSLCSSNAPENCTPQPTGRPNTSAPVDVSKFFSDTRVVTASTATIGPLTKVLGREVIVELIGKSTISSDQSPV